MEVPAFPFTSDQGLIGQVVSGAPIELLGEELSTISEGVALKRRYDLRRGRMAARQAITQLLGPGNYPILRGERGQPIFPASLRGSISHCAGIAIAVVGYADRYRAVGVDIELLAARKLDVGVTIATANERRWLAENPDFPIAILFSAKESIYKAIAPIIGRYIGFQEVELRWNEGNQSFDVETLSNFGEATDLMRTLRVRASMSASMVLTLATT